MEFSEDKRYQVKGYEGVAFRFDSYPKRWVWDEVLDVDEDGNEISYCADSGEWIEDLESPMVYMVMVGDDYRHLIDKDDISELDELAYCAECGQIGCTQDGRER